MGLILSLVGTALTTVADVWQDYIYCDSLGNDILLKKGRKRRHMGESIRGNFLADENVITEHSNIVVNDGQILLIVENGKIIDFCAEPGGYEFDSKLAPSAFVGSFGQDLKNIWTQMKDRFVFGGVAHNDQRAYYINTKEILNNRFGFGNVPYRDSEFNMTIALQGFGNFSYRIVNPLAFYTNIAGNVADVYDKSMIEPQIKAELQDALMPALGALARQGVRYDELPSNVKTITNELKKALIEQWKETRGIEIVSMSLANIRPDDESINKIRVLQESRAYSTNKAMLGARVGVAQANAMETAAANANGAATGFMGMHIASQMGGVNVSELMNEPANQNNAAPQGDSWKCECGNMNVTKFCPNCGKPRPERKASFCPNCGCDTGGGKFCPNCGTKVQ